MIDLIGLSTMVPGILAKAIGSGTPPAPVDIAKAGEDFTNVLKQGEAAAIKGITGDMPLQQAVERVLEAERTLQTAITVRDKLVASYLEITRMQI
jgi:flagellar hook-basal body complex protein FliE